MTRFNAFHFLSRHKLGLVLVLLFVTTVSWLWLSSAHEPVYHGRRLGEWLMDLPWTMPDGTKYSVNSSRSHGTVYVVGHQMPLFEVKTTGGSSTDEEEKALEAIRQIGTNALPRLVALLRAKDFPLKPWIAALASRLPYVEVRITLAFQRRAQALTALVALGPAAKPAVPALLKMTGDRSPSVRDAAKHALKQIDSAAAAQTRGE